MGTNEEPTSFQEVVERSYRAQWGGRRFYVTTAVVLFIIAILSAAILPLVRQEWVDFTSSVKEAVEISALVTSFLCLIGSVLAGAEALIRWQRERSQFPSKAVHAAMTLSVITFASLAFLLYLFADSTWKDSSIVDLQQTIRFVVLLATGLVWMSSIVITSAGISLMIFRRSEMLEVNNTPEGTALFFRKGHSTEVVKLCIATLIPLIIFITALLMSSYALSGSGISS